MNRALGNPAGEHLLSEIKGVTHTHTHTLQIPHCLVNQLSFETLGNGIIIIIALSFFKYA